VNKKKEGGVMNNSIEKFRQRQSGKVEGDYICPQCREKTVLSSGFSGNPFCWGVCYRYFTWEQIRGAQNEPRRTN